MMLKVGLIGRGAFGKKHEQKLKEIHGMEYIGFSDPRYADSISRVMLIDFCDALVIATPMETHYQIARECLMKGKHVLVEKPITTNLWEAIELQHLAEDHGVVFYVGHLERFYNIPPDIRKELDFSLIRSNTKDSKDVLLDLAIHSFDLALGIVKDIPAEIRVTRLVNGYDCVIEFANQRLVRAITRINTTLERRIYGVDFIQSKQDVLREELEAFVAECSGQVSKIAAKGWDGIRALNLALRCKDPGPKEIVSYGSNIYWTSVIGNGVSIGFASEIGRNVVIGARTRISAMSFIPEGIVIEEDCFIGPRVTFTNDMYPPSGRSKWQRTRVKKGARIGAGAIILPGVTIGEKALIGAGSVVCKDVSEGVTVVGNPAKTLRGDVG